MEKNQEIQGNCQEDFINLEIVETSNMIEEALEVIRVKYNEIKDIHRNRERFIVDEIRKLNSINILELSEIIEEYERNEFEYDDIISELREENKSKDNIINYLQEEIKKLKENSIEEEKKDTDKCKCKQEKVNSEYEIDQMIVRDFLVHHPLNIEKFNTRDSHTTQSVKYNDFCKVYAPWECDKSNNSKEMESKCEDLKESLDKLKKLDTTPNYAHIQFTSSTQPSCTELNKIPIEECRNIYKNDPIKLGVINILSTQFGYKYLSKTFLENIKYEIK